MSIGYLYNISVIQNIEVRTFLLGGYKNELCKGIPGISQKVLTDNLRSLESYGLINRKVYPEVPPRVEYSLSDIGYTLKPMFESMTNRGNLYKDLINEKEQKK